MKSVKMFGKSVPLLAIIITSLLAIGASAGLLTYFGTLTSTANVDQSVRLDGGIVPVTEIVPAIGGNTETGDLHYIQNHADVQIVADLVVGSYDIAFDNVYPEYKLDAIIDDDWVKFDLSDDVVWSAFTGITFDYLIDEGPNEWIPQINLKLLDSEGNVAYYASWISPEEPGSWGTGIDGTVGERATITYDKGDFVIFDAATWHALGQWSDVVGGAHTHVCALGEACPLPIDPTEVNVIKTLVFDTFTQQAGCTVHDPNTDVLCLERISGGISSQIVYVSNHVVNGGSATITGVNVHPLAYGDAYRSALEDPSYENHQWETVEFRMVYVFEFDAETGSYPVTTNLVPIGLP